MRNAASHFAQTKHQHRHVGSLTLGQLPPLHQSLLARVHEEVALQCQHRPEGRFCHGLVHRRVHHAGDWHAGGQAGIGQQAVDTGP